MLDTNVWLDWLVFDDPSVAGLRAALHEGRCRLISCAHARAELADVLARPQFAKRLPDVAPALAQFDHWVQLVESPARCGLRSKDPDDQVFIDLAVAQHADFLFSRDKALLALARRAREQHQVRVLRPSDADGQLRRDAV